MRWVALLLVVAAVAAAEEAVRVSCVAGAAGGAAWRWAAAAGQLAASALGGAGVTAPHPALAAACAAPDSRRCLRGTLETLREAGGVEVAAAAAAGAGGRLARALRDAGLVDLGDVAPPARRVLLAVGGAARAHTDLADPALARLYELQDDDLRELGASDADLAQYVCAAVSPCATVLVDSEGEALVVAGALPVRAVPLAGGLRARAAGLAALAARRPLLLATWSTQLAALQRALPAAAPLLAPACAAPPEDEAEPAAKDDRVDCPFEERRLVKLADGFSAARLSAELRALSLMYLSGADVAELGEPDAAAGWAAQHRARLELWRAAAESSEARVAVLVPRSGPRRAHHGAALAAAAALAAEDACAAPAGNLHYSVQVEDAGCSAPLAYRAATGALSSGEYSTLSALAGPACGAALSSVATLGRVLRMPVLAYTAVAPPADAAGWLVLSAGDARTRRVAASEVMALFGWRRAAQLAETGAIDAAAASAELVLVQHEEVEGGAVDAALAAAARRWAAGAAAAGARVLQVAAEDGRVLRAALCAARGAGLPAGAAWLLSTWPPPPPPPPAPTGTTHNETTCTDDELDEIADGHLSIMEEWEWRWISGTSDSNRSEEESWRTRWARQCREERGGEACGAGSGAEAPPQAALLYDVLGLWRRALAALLRAQPAALRDLHDPRAAAALLRHLANDTRAGLTGAIEWAAVSTGAGNVTARRSELVLTQWSRRGGRTLVARREAGRWKMERQPVWRTSDGAPPDDGSEKCALGGLAHLLGGDCRAAGVALAAGVLALLAAVAAAAAWRGKRRAEKRCQAVAMRELRKPPPLDRWELPRERVVINRRLGVGAFGAVYGGHALLGDAGWTPVAVKTLKPGADTDDKLEFLSEAETMKRFDHKNIVRLLGVVTATEPACTVMEFMLHGDLKSYLLARRHLAAGGAAGAEGGADEADDVSPRRLTALARDAARALSYLCERRFVHRDVAARNCLVSARRVLKLADFGMARPVFDSDYYRFGRKGMLPVRWMAPESLALGVFSAASDVWSLGVLLYETATLGALPHQGLSNRQVVAAVQGGAAPGPPPGASPRLAALLAACWQARPEARPRASEVAALLGDAPRLVAPCLAPGALPPGAPLPRAPSPSPAGADWPLPSDATEATYLSEEPPSPQPDPDPLDPLLPLPF